MEISRLLVANPSYLLPADIKAMALDYDISGYTDPQIQLMLNAASAKINAIIKQQLLASERTVRLFGNGSNVLSLRRRPIIYIRKMQFVQPGLSGFIIPLNRVLVDSIRGEVVQYSPLELQGIGYVSIFPLDLPIDVTYGVGYGYNPFVPPSYTTIDAPPVNNGLAPGAYTLGVTVKTQWGETLPTFTNVTTATGAISITITPQMGAYIYRAFLAVGANQDSNVTLVAEIPATTFGGEATKTIVSSLVPLPGYFAESAPTVDTSALTLPEESKEATRLLFLSIIYEQNNLANRGVAKTESSKKSVSWRSTEGNSGKGIPRFYEEAMAVLAPFKYQSIG